MILFYNFLVVFPNIEKTTENREKRSLQSTQKKQFLSHEGAECNFCMRMLSKFIKKGFI